MAATAAADLMRADRTIEKGEVESCCAVREPVRLLRDKCEALVRAFRKPSSAAEREYTLMKIDQMRQPDREFSYVARSYFDRKLGPANPYRSDSPVAAGE
jgi:hypothetical protein